MQSLQEASSKIYGAEITSLFEPNIAINWPEV